MQRAFYYAHVGLCIIIKNSFPRTLSTVPIKPDEADDYKRRTFDPDFRAGYVITTDELLYLNKINANHFTYRVCKEHLYTVNNGLLFQKNSYLIEAFNKAILNLQSNGLIDYWISNYIDVSYLNVKEKKKSAEKLTIHQLSGSFQLWLVGLLIASICFILEIIFEKYHNFFVKAFTWWC